MDLVYDPSEISLALHYIYRYKHVFINPSPARNHDAK
jgi:hypothetical protein